MAGLKDTQDSKKTVAIKPFGPSALVAAGVDPEKVAEAVARAIASNAKNGKPIRFPDYVRGKYSPGAAGVPMVDRETGEVRSVDRRDLVAKREDLPDPASAPSIPGAELFDVEEVAGIRIVRPTEPVTHAALAMAVQRFIDWSISTVDDITARREGFHGLIPDPRNAAHVQAVWNLVRGERSEPTPRTRVEHRRGVPVAVLFDRDAR